MAYVCQPTLDNICLTTKHKMLHCLSTRLCFVDMSEVARSHLGTAHVAEVWHIVRWHIVSWYIVCWLHCVLAHDYVCVPT